MPQKSSKSVVSGAGGTESAMRRQLKDAIICQKLAPGQKVTETGLAEMLSTSRTVARSLMEQLIVQDFLVSVSARMTRVSPLTVVSIKENFLLRRMIMPELIAMSISNVDLDAMAKMNQTNFIHQSEYRRRRSGARVVAAQSGVQLDAYRGQQISPATCMGSVARGHGDAYLLDLRQAARKTPFSRVSTRVADKGDAG